MIRERTIRTPHYQEVLDAKRVVEKYENSVTALEPHGSLEIRVGDLLNLKEWDPFTGDFTGRDSWYIVTLVDIDTAANIRVIEFEPTTAP